jgi:hypothetical protein
MATNAAKPVDPYPDGLYGISESVGLAMVAGLQRLPARERAVVALTDVAGFGVGEVAEMLEATEDWVDRTRQRARLALAARPSVAGAEPPPEAGSEMERSIVERLQAALEEVDAGAIVDLLADDVTLSCTRRWAVYRGRDRVADILCGRMCDERLRLVPTRANGQPAFGCYGPDGRARGLLAITLCGGRVANLTRFWDNAVLPYFDLPERLG